MKKKIKSKGLSDKELIEKYESGKIKSGELMKKMLSTPNPNIPSKPKKK
jgi:hypothetical protein